MGGLSPLPSPHSPIPFLPSPSSARSRLSNRKLSSKIFLPSFCFFPAVVYTGSCSLLRNSKDAVFSSFKTTSDLAVNCSSRLVLLHLQSTVTRQMITGMNTTLGAASATKMYQTVDRSAYSEGENGINKVVSQAPAFFCQTRVSFKHLKKWLK